ncbi:glycosyltransferase [Alteriqipengyuania flavescens]|uniref:glycosyltransferase n=1 Tax=Alteriqipengyuania flavescens TaxID=3053610 RepID=UPI0025B618A8|nr:glycosyltransferase [Alteriqipengyuania flavescens]WJY19097.1 glycosyltransferase [Alteriqipengyuania flavescens]WJY25038.1 glycosyltransferase [Alteriqipengyuania flavescens]
MPGSAKPLLICDLTQSYSAHGGGGISTYLREKREYLAAKTPHRHLQIVPGPEDRIVERGNHIWCEIGSDPVRGSPNYRFILRTSKVREVLAHYQPDVIESLCPWILPWTAIRHRRAFPGTALVAGYRTDFPEAHVHRVATDVGGKWFGKFMRFMSICYGEITYREFDRIYTLGRDNLPALAEMKVDRVDMLNLGVDTNLFSPEARDPAFRSELGLSGPGPLLAYAGRIDNEKKADRLVELMRRLPRDMGAGLVMLGDGKLREPLEEVARAEGLPIAFTGFIGDRAQLARALASSDIYVSAMADETFGISIIEAQSCGLPVVGVHSGAMPARVTPQLGRLGPVDDIDAMAGFVQEIWRGEIEAMGQAARDHVLANFSWDRTFERLLGTVYPPALARAARRVGRPAPTAVLTGAPLPEAS